MMPPRGRGGDFFSRPRAWAVFSAAEGGAAALGWCSRLRRIAVDQRAAH